MPQQINEHRKFQSRRERQTLMGSGIIVFPVLKELEEFLGSPLFKETHQRTLDGLHFSTRDFGDPSITIDETPSNLLELEVAGDIGVNKDLCELHRSDDELGNEIDGIITVTAKFRGRLLAWTELAVQLRALSSVPCSSCSTRS